MSQFRHHESNLENANGFAVLANLSTTHKRHAADQLTAQTKPATTYIMAGSIIWTYIIMDINQIINIKL
ncbi:hypothetical protein CDQ84_08750 [Clostridium thermosuccinogenes]|uniref:Uncharacterized protein n=1 Tax=Clostridium thermosuccinogenes TaxID=84032 RepID=A0A2K2FEZ7_9CLOT|nr:hypothetical protein CDO33_15055 [Pseudoclostridium thermosuccinogenes]PNT93897.1 hypothetical protein CDQ83_10555 [Pseudoclostridium thermosuccinogenes]PNT97357.1 hypothetical protein CDQ85_08600 [Pseudoclostridium thermosuccinogenes]PNT99293.1 hypothetical protein CDQ84_08750 [Pseudoclostridium thermosuccinogenes]